ncbi:MerR family transcriptional regulator [Lactobacillus sp. DCY120]|uniref:MerR family transcriptional regulator n=1 Tax=Bombilactobacillus apium TaxID=2675299 RepID=A0A850QZ20_9LACO|nr:MerR family transcriptional regulator [Bombilactobacillus apium]NVY95999.1 MerR family transcriptional regulator [Bombilactobacillus apium]
MEIDEVSKKCGIPSTTLRYWEKIGLLPPIKRSKSGYREYQQRDLNWILYIQALRNAGMEISNLKKFIDSYRNSDQNSKRKQILIDQQQELIQRINKIQQTLNYLNYKIDDFDSHMISYEEEKLAYRKIKK